MLQRTVLVALTAAVIMALPAYADDTDATPAPLVCQRDGAPVPDDDLKAARDILTLTHATDRMNTIMAALVPILLQSIRHSSPDMTDALANEISADLLIELTGSEDAALQAVACIYAQHYSSGDLRQLTAFYQSAVGQKLITLGPVVLKESIAAGQEWGRHAGEAAVRRVLAKHMKDGNKT